MLSSSVVKQEVPDSAEDYSAGSSQSLELRRTKKELAKTNKDVQDLRTLLQSTSEAHDAKLDALQAKFDQSTREVHDFRHALQSEMDTIIRMVSGGPWMFTQPPVLQNIPQQYFSNQDAPLTSQPLGTDGFATSQQLQTFTQPPVSQNFPQEYIVNQGAPPSQQPPNVAQATPTRAEFSKLPGIPITEVVEECVFCENPLHKSQDCKRIKSGTWRLNIVKKNHICVRCLKPKDHNGNQKCSKDVCSICHNKHNTALCNKNESRHCSFCESRDHFDKECPKYFIDVSVTDRRAMLEKENRCLYCFKLNSDFHSACHKSLCFFCMKKYNDRNRAFHHKFLCPEQMITPSSEPSIAEVKKEGNRYAPYP